METISLRLDKEFLQDIERYMKKYSYTTKTEFVRAALREKINQLKKEELLDKVAALAGSSKKRTTDEQLHKAGDKAFDILEKRLKSK